MIGKHLTIPQICDVLIENGDSEGKKAGEIIKERYLQLREEAEKLQNEIDSIEAAYMMDFKQIETILQIICNRVNGPFEQIISNIKTWIELEDDMNRLRKSIRIEPKPKREIERLEREEGI